MNQTSFQPIVRFRDPPSFCVASNRAGSGSAVKSVSWWTWLIVLGSWALPTLGQVTLSPTAVVDSDMGSFGASTPYENMINQSGLDTPFVNGVTDFATYFATPGQTFAQANFANNWQSEISSELPQTGYIDFDLGASYRLDGMAVWNISLQDVTVTIFDELTNPGVFAGSFTLTDHLNFPFSYPVDVLDFGGEFEGRYVRLDVDSTYLFDPPNDFFSYGIVGEVVLSVSPIPEPGTWSLLAAGALVLGVGGFRRGRG
jgi:hypothetical protein